MAGRNLRNGLRQILRPELFVLCPAFLLGWVWFGLDGVFVVAATGLPLAWLTRTKGPAPQQDNASGTAPASPLGALTAAMDRSFATDSAVRPFACLVLALDDPGTLRAAFGPLAYDAILRKVDARLRGVLRDNDMLSRIGGDRFAVALAPDRRLDLEAAILIAGRLLSAMDEPLSIDAATVHVSLSAGFCLSGRAPELNGSAMLDAAGIALEAALKSGPHAIRGHTAEIAKAAAARDALQERVEGALENGEIVAYFQPQLSTDTGAITGFEALARWQHPESGVLEPTAFMPAIVAAGLGGRLGEVMLDHALSALRGWDAEGLGVPRVAVNFSREELRDPAIAPKLEWQLDRFGISPGRLSVEVLETVAAETGDDMIVRNIAALSKLGCPIDLDDFGTGNASIAAIRRFAVDRVKIDRSYITRIDSDPAQQRMIAAILSMAERLGLQTLAEGVETIREHAMLAQLGCDHVQGFAIARPMPVQQTSAWICKHRNKLAGGPPEIGRRTG